MAFKIGFCYLHSEDVGDVDLALDYFSSAQEHINKRYKDNFKEQEAPIEVEYYLGVCYRLKADYGNAITHFKAYRTSSKRNMKTLTDELIDREIKSCEYSMTNPPEKFNVKRYIFDVTIPEGQFLRCPVVSGNDSVFVYTLGTQNIYPPDINTDREVYHLPVDDIYYSVWKNDKWTDPELISKQINMNGYTMPVSLSYDGTKLLLIHDDKDNGNIYMSELKNNSWTSAKKLNKNINTRKWESHAFMTKDSEKLYFTSARKGGYGGLDLWVSHINDEGEWDEPENLGEHVNTEYHEELPFIIEKGNQIFFGSEAHDNMGGFDMFVSVFDSIENNWPSPINLGSPYNTVGNDLAYVVTFHDKFIYCPQNSNKRRKGISGSDCFSLRMPYEDKIVTLKGQIFIPELSNIIPSDLIIAAIDKNTGDTITVVSPDIDGKFTIDDLKAGKVTLITMASESVKKQTVEVIVPKDYKEIEYPLDIYLESQEIALADTKETDAIALTIKNIFFNFDKYNIRDEFLQNLNSLASYMVNHPELVIEIQGNCDYYGTDSYNMWLGRMRAQSILSYLAQKGVEKDNMSVISYGETKPIAKSIKSDDSRKYNRRAMIVVKTDTKEISVEEIVIPEEFQIQ